ncbi:MAG: polynucleotide adenylyltransferase PcnB [Bordetella sp.]|nr:MAG: polynucleotide adenylyltransferase PcnB [Bordetella sp.]
MQNAKKFIGNLLPNHQNNKPKKIARCTHGIDPKYLSKNAVNVCKTLHNHGYEAYIVGGAVRDLIIGLKPKDFDVVTNAKPSQIQSLFKRARIIGKRFQLVHVSFGREIIETSTFRSNASETLNIDNQGRILLDNAFGSQPEDAKKRDFTINALYYDPNTEEVTDYHNGIIDLKKGIIRIIGNASERYREDPIRILRAIRFAAKFNGKIDKASNLPMPFLASKLIQNVPQSRLFDEIIKILTCGYSIGCLEQILLKGLHCSSIPILNIALDQFSSTSFVQLALKNTDSRVKEGKSVSCGFLFAVLLWKKVKLQFEKFEKSGRFNIKSSMIQAVKCTINEQTKKLNIHRRFSVTMSEIWLMQTNFDRRLKKIIYHTIKQSCFRAACDFLQLRAAFGEFDIGLAQWWMNLANANINEREKMIDSLNDQSNENISELCK